jgi:anti-sigma regulatory factor (Ser/Thr protein kinase)
MSDRRQTWHFPPLHHLVGVTRDEAAKTVADWGLADLADALELVLSELITNAIKHGRPPDDQDIILSLYLTGEGVRGEVRDHGPGIPRQVHPDDDTEGGRGLFLVDAFTAAWGWEPLPTGKAVWFELRAQAP